MNLEISPEPDEAERAAIAAALEAEEAEKAQAKPSRLAEPELYSGWARVALKSLGALHA